MKTVYVSASAVACMALAAVVGLAFALEDQTQLVSLVTTLLTGAATLITIIVTLGRTEQIGNTVEDLANGRMDAKIRAAVAQVIQDRYLDPDAAEQLAQDRTRIAEHPDD